MQIGYIGLGKMGFNMVERLIEKNYEVVVFDKNTDAVRDVSVKGALPADSLKSLVASLMPPRTIWLMVPHQAVDSVLQELSPLLQKRDTVIDGGNSPYSESMRRFQDFAARELNFLDVGVSGGPWGARNGACIMVGGKKEIFRRYRGLFRDLSWRGGFTYTGNPGSGHFVKMVHNGIEYGIMQALAEGFAVMKASPFDLDLRKVAKLYNRRSVIESRMVGWLQQAYQEYGQDLSNISGAVSHSGEAEWTIEAAKELGIPVPIIEGSLKFRILSQVNPSYTGQVLSALRNQFGGHEVSGKHA